MAAHISRDQYHTVPTAATWEVLLLNPCFPEEQNSLGLWRLLSHGELKWSSYCSSYFNDAHGVFQQRSLALPVAWLVARLHSVLVPVSCNVCLGACSDHSINNWVLSSTDWHRGPPSGDGSLLCRCCPPSNTLLCDASWAAGLSTPGSTAGTTIERHSCSVPSTVLVGTGAGFALTGFLGKYFK